jgi:hypothetical protein
MLGLYANINFPELTAVERILLLLKYGKIFDFIIKT